MNGISRRSVLRGIGVAGAGVAFGGTVLSRTATAGAATTAGAAVDLPRLTVLTDRAGAAPGSIFCTPGGEDSNGLLIADRHGVTTHFQPVDGVVGDFRVQAYRDARRLTWWQGTESPGQAHGTGVDYLADQSYQVVGSIGTVDGLQPTCTSSASRRGTPH